MRSIDTIYAGCRFRSRLEARWAVFFDALGIAWEYEWQGYQVPRWRGAVCHTPYLPDFELPAAGVWVEVKGDPARLDKALLLDVADQRWSHGPRRGVVILGSLPRPDGEPAGTHTFLTADPYGGDVRGRSIWHRQAEFTWDGRVEVADWEGCLEPMSMESDPCGCDWLSPGWTPAPHFITSAYATARSARFERQYRPRRRSFGF